MQKFCCKASISENNILMAQKPSSSMVDSRIKTELTMPKQTTNHPSFLHVGTIKTENQRVRAHHAYRCRFDDPFHSSFSLAPFFLVLSTNRPLLFGLQLAQVGDVQQQQHQQQQQQQQQQTDDGSIIHTHTHTYIYTGSRGL